jgi:outer membrane protein assembly factor BamE (lipoprotein component of BamABCDE complex)
MKTHLFLCSLLALPLFASAASTRDTAADLLAQHGSIAVSSAGAHVSAGTFRVQVAAKLGRPDLVLPDGTWLYHGRNVPESSARGTLVVRFDQGRVSSLSLAGPTVVASLRAESRTPADASRVASK